MAINTVKIVRSVTSWTCDECGAVEEVETVKELSHSPIGFMPETECPDGWKHVNIDDGEWKLLCPAHEVKIVTTGGEVDEAVGIQGSLGHDQRGPQRGST